MKLGGLGDSKYQGSSTLLFLLLCKYGGFRVQGYCGCLVLRMLGSSRGLVKPRDHDVLALGAQEQLE